MKKELLAATAVAGMILGAAIAQGADSKGAGIVNSVHDLSARNTVGALYGLKTNNGVVGDPGTRICAYCHSPHHSNQTNVNGTTNANDLSAAVANLTSDPSGGTDATMIGKYNIYAPLWSRTDLSKVGGYGMYLSQTFNPNADGRPYDPLIGPSRLCLTCHDGSIALDNYYGNTNTTSNTTGDAFNGPMGGGDQASIGIAGGNGLMNDHPIGMNYNDYANDSTGRYEIRVASSHFQTTDGTASNKTIDSVLYRDPTFSGLGSTTSGDGFVTCASCHDVHNGNAVGNKQPTGNMRGFLLYGSQIQSSFCLTCHDKNGTQGIPAGN